MVESALSGTSMTLGLLSEIFTIVCFPIGLLLLIVAVMIRAIRGGWVTVEGAVSGSELRWLGPGDTLYKQRLDDEDAEMIAEYDGVTVHYRTFSPHRAQLERVAHDEKLLRVLGTVFVGVGIVAVAVSIVATVIG